MELTFGDVIRLLPLLMLTGLSVVLMLVISVRRAHTPMGTVTVLGLILTFLVTLFEGAPTPAHVTPLFLVDGLAWFFSLVLLGVSAGIAVFAYAYLQRLHDHCEEFYLLLVVATLGALVMVNSDHYVSAFLGMETLSIALYAMVAYTLHDRGAAKFPLEAGVKYLVLSALASAILLFGVALVYAQTGTLSFSSVTRVSGMGQALPSAFASLGMVMIVAGMAFKLSLVPFHIWTPDVYEGAPLPATTLLATTGKAAMSVLLLRLLASTDAMTLPAVVGVVSLVAAASMLGGNLLALVQGNLKRLLAYSSIAHMGYLLVALVILGSAPGGGLSAEAVGFYLLAYIVMSLGAFGAVTAVSGANREFDQVADYHGLFWRQPWLALLLTTMLLSLAGIPLTAGFLGKFYVVLAGVQGGHWALLGFLVVGSGIGVFYYLRVIYRMLQPVEGAALPAYPETAAPSLGLYVVLGLLLLLVFWLGILPGPWMSLLATLAVGV